MKRTPVFLLPFWFALLASFQLPAQWTPQVSGTDVLLMDVFFVSPSTGWAVGLSGRIFKTINGGADWGIQQSGTSEGLLSVFFTDTNTGWAVGAAGTILSTIDGGGPMQLLPRTLPIPNCQDIALPLNASGQATLTPEMVDPQAAPPTDPFIWSVSQTTFNCSDIAPEPVFVMLSVTDGVSTNSCTFNVNLELEAECVTLPIAASLTDPGDGSDPVMYIWPTEIFNDIPFDCYSALSTDPSGPWAFGCEDVGTNIVTATITLENGYSKTCDASITIYDPLDTYSCHGFTLQLNENGQATLLPDNVVDATTLCGSFPDFISLSQTNFDCSHIGTQTVTVSIAPPFSALETCEVEVEVVGAAVPPFTCQDITLELDENGQATLTPEMIAPDLTDNCGYSTTALSHTLFDCNNLGDPGPNYALEFRGSRKEFVQFISPVAGATDFTVEAWFVNDNQQNFFPTHLLSWGGYGLEVYDDAGALYVRLGSSLAAITTPTRDGLWHHIAVVREGPSAAVYLDGAEAWSGPTDVSLTGLFQLGRRFSTAATGDPSWVGVADDLRIWNTARSALDIQGNRFNQLSGAEAGLAGYWPLNDGPGSAIATDWSPNLLHGALSTRVIQLDSWVTGAPLNTGNAAGVLLTATDAAGNTISCAATVTLTTSMEARCKNIYVQLGEDGQASIAPEEVDFGSYASCGALSLSVSPADFTCEEVGINVVTLTATNDNGETASCTAQVTVGQGFRLYGTGSLGAGSLFSMKLDGSDFVEHDLAGLGYGEEEPSPYGPPNVLLAPDGFLYGITEHSTPNGGSYGQGTGSIFRIMPDGNGFDPILPQFPGGYNGGANPFFQSELSFSPDCTWNGADDCYLYGTVWQGGMNNQGGIFRIRSNGEGYQFLYRFKGANENDGKFPLGGLIAGNDGRFYGMAQFGGLYNHGTIYRFVPPTPDQESVDIEVVHHFKDSSPQQEGYTPIDELVIGEDGRFYGITQTGGGGVGALFRFDPEDLTYEKLHTFTVTTGGYPRSKPIIADGFLYGTTATGHIYRIHPDAPDTYQVLISIFPQRPFGNMIYAPDGYLYGGATDFPATNGNGFIYRIRPDGTDFLIIHSFEDGAFSGNPTNGLLLVPTSCCDDDLYAPELTCPSAIELIDLDGNGTEPIADLAALGFSAFDDCTEAAMSISPEVFPLGSMEAVVTAVDEGGNTATCTVTVVVTGPCGDEEMKFITSDGEGKYFGNSVGISGTRVIVGVHVYNVSGNNSGSAFIYHWNGFEWEEHQLIPDDGNAGDYFGSSVAISGDKAIVGAYGDDDNGSYSGSAYLFHWDGANWIQQQKITAADGSSGDYFGWYSVAIEGETAIVGAYGDDDNGSSSGSAYLFHWDGANWVQQQKITASEDGAEGDYFGISVDINGGRAIVGARHDDNDNGENSGSAYLFHWNGDSWEEQQKIVASAPYQGAAGDLFGGSVSISGDKALVGARHDDNDNGENSGSAYLFHWNEATAQWEQQDRITASDSQNGDSFGWSVSISANKAIVGAFESDPNGPSSGSAYIFEWNGLEWVEQEKLTAFDGENYDGFGYSVGISGNRAIAGARFEDENSNNAGAAYPFLLGLTGATPELSVTPPAPVCPGEPFDLSTLAVTDANGTNPFLTYHSGTPATPLNELASPIVTPESPSSTYYILGAARSGCTDEVAVTLEAPTAPTLTCQDITVELNPFNQQAVVYPDQVASVEPDCPGFTLYFLGGNTALPPLPMIFNGCSSIGEHQVAVFLYNGQGGGRRRVCRATITVVAPPVASCEEGLNVALSQDGALTLNPVDLNQGSYALCGSITDMTVSPAVLNCADVGTTEVTLTVTTDDGQTASCSTEIGVSPWIGELCDGIDNNCNGIIDDSPIDQDGDGYNICEDCDDTDAGIHPGAPEICDGIDNNCNGEIDEGGLVAVLEGVKLIADNSAGDDPNNEPSGDYFGLSVSISGDWAIVGASNDENPNGQGAAYFFKLEGTSWVQMQKVTPSSINGPDETASDYFAASVAIDGDWAIVGAPTFFEDFIDGAAYVYHLEGGIWVEKQKLTAYDGNASASGNLFGFRVAIDNGRAIVSATRDLSDTGSAYMFHLEGGNWTPQVPKFTAYDGQIGDLFGAGVSISGDWAIVTSQTAGSGYLFYWDGSVWAPQTPKLTVYDEQYEDNFGSSVSIGGDWIIIGDPGNDNNGENSGAAYLFHREGSNWVPQIPKLTAYDEQSGDLFGTSVSISGNTVLVGANRSNSGATNTGAAYLFQLEGNSWLAQLPKITSNDGQTGDLFGHSVFVNGDRRIIGAYREDNENGANAGAAYISGTVSCGGALRPAPDPILPPVAQAAEAKTDFMLYPNPALEEVFLEFDIPLTGDAEVWIYDLAGRPALRRTLEAGADWMSIPLEQLMPGLYLVEVKSGEQVFEGKRFVKGGD
ncbi:MAG: T9SS type A sorting domain-containing protein [Phaeodactylibacter sp.]|nr:T9SS type A sorting domain-containing protein [Phaeodactylibacter sp.]